MQLQPMPGRLEPPDLVPDPRRQPHLELSRRPIRRQAAPVLLEAIVPVSLLAMALVEGGEGDVGAQGAGRVGGEEEGEGDVVVVDALVFVLVFEAEEEGEGGVGEGEVVDEEGWGGGAEGEPEEEDDEAE